MSVSGRMVFDAARLVSFALGGVLLILAVTGCTTRPHTLGMMPDEKSTVCKVAMLPFYNQSRYRLGDTLAYRVFMAELVTSGLFDVMLEGEVRTFFRENRQLPGTEMSRDVFTKMGETMNVDAIILGTVLVMEEGSEGSEMVVPSASLRLELIRVSDGRPLMVSYHRRSGEDFRKLMHIGVIQTMAGLVSQISKEVITEWKNSGLKGCAEL